MKRGIYAGSFDPVTLGHLDVIRRAGLIVDEFQFISSTTIKELASYRSTALCKYVTPCVASALSKRIDRARGCLPP